MKVNTIRGHNIDSDCLSNPGLLWVRTAKAAAGPLLRTQNQLRSSRHTVIAIRGSDFDLSPPSSPGLSQVKTAEATTEPLSKETTSTWIVLWVRTAEAAAEPHLRTQNRLRSSAHVRVVMQEDNVTHPTGKPGLQNEHTPSTRPLTRQGLWMQAGPHCVGEGVDKPQSYFEETASLEHQAQRPGGLWMSACRKKTGRRGATGRQEGSKESGEDKLEGKRCEVRGGGGFI